MNTVRDELLQLIVRLQSASHASEAEQDADIERLRLLSPEPMVMDLLFDQAHEQMTPAQMVDRILAYRPIRL